MGSRKLVIGQVAYFRARAREYDETAYGSGDSLDEAAVARLVADLRPVGDVVELACGTGVWTQHLIGHVRHLTAVDAAPEMIALAQSRVQGMPVEFVVADVFEWRPRRRFDNVFFAFWLSHVPLDRFDEFWVHVGEVLVEGGRCMFVDEHEGAARKETYRVPTQHVAERRLADGSVHQIVKVCWEPTALEARMASIGWRSTTRVVSPTWFVAEATRELVLIG